MLFFIVEIWEKSWERVRSTSPECYSFSDELSIVYVFPAPVIPYMNMVELNPWSTFLMGEVIVFLKTWRLVADGENTSSYLNTLSVSEAKLGGNISTSFWLRILRTEWGWLLGDGFTLRNIWMFYWKVEWSFMTLNSSGFGLSLPLLRLDLLSLLMFLVWWGFCLSIQIINVFIEGKVQSFKT